jgi:hypothetical protein
VNAWISPGQWLLDARNEVLVLALPNDSYGNFADTFLKIGFFPVAVAIVCR